VIQKSLADIARETVVSIDSPEEGEATGRKAIQLVRVEPSEKMTGSLIALYDDGSVYECYDGSTAWAEVEMP
jgi:hypothetical protein